MSLPQFGYTYTTRSPPLVQMSNQQSPTSCCESGRPIMTDPHTGQTVCSCQVDSRLLSYPRLATGLPVGGLYGSAYSDQGYVSFGADPSAFYSPLNNSYDLKDGAPAAWSSLTQAAAYYSYDPTMAAYPYSNGYGGVDLNGAARRKNATKEVTSTLKAWLYEHRKNPYPTKGEKIMLAIITKMTLTQVSTWFANARRRLKKENKMTWEPRNRVDDDDKSDIENDNDQGSKDGQDSGPKDVKYKDGESHVKLHDLSCDKTQDSDDLMNKNCPKTRLDDLDPDSRSSSPASPLSLSSHTGLSQSSLGGLSDPSRSPDLSTIKSDLNSNKPRIWSLAHTATSNSPPLCRKSPPPSTLQGFGASHMSQHPAMGGKMGMPMGHGMQMAQTSNLASRPDLRTWIEGAFHGASALTAMGIAAQYHGLVSSANTMQGNNVCMGSGASATAPQGSSMDRVGGIGTMGSMVPTHPSASIPASPHLVTMNNSRSPVSATVGGLDTGAPPQNPTSASISCRLPQPNNGGLKVGVGFSSSCNTVNTLGQTSIFASVKSSLCGLTGDRVGLHSGLTNVNRTTAQTEVLSTAFRPVTKT